MSTKESKGDVRKHIIARFTSLSREILKQQTDDRLKKKQLDRMEEECFAFQNYLDKDAQYLRTAISRCKTLVESCLKIYLGAVGQKCSENFFENESLLKRASGDGENDLLYHYIKTVRLGTTKKSNPRDVEYEEDETIFILFLSLSVLERLFQGIVSSKKESSPVPIRESSPQITVIRKDSPKNGFIKEIESLEFSSNGQIVLVNEKEHPSVCMENACGLPCYRHCAEHSNEKVVYLSFATIGTVKCNFGEECKKNRKTFRMSSGQEVSVCPYLHGDRFDDIKKRIGFGWLYYSKNQINFQDIFALGQMTVENHSKVNLINSKRCKFLPCMENACGAVCHHNCAEHSNETNVFHSYTKIGSEKCEYGSTCKKHGKLIPMPAGRYCTQCPFLHGDKYDDVKKRVGLGWILYASGSISFDQIFTADDVSGIPIESE